MTHYTYILLVALDWDSLHTVRNSGLMTIWQAVVVLQSVRLWIFLRWEWGWDVQKDIEVWFQVWPHLGGTMSATMLRFHMSSVTLLHCARMSFITLVHCASMSSITLLHCANITSVTLLHWARMTSITLLHCARMSSITLLHCANTASVLWLTVWWRNMN